MVGLVVATMCAVAAIAHATVEGMSWTAAFILGAVVAPTDPVAALATFGRLGVPRRARLLVECEAVLNDERDALVGLRNTGRLRPDILREIERDLVLEELRLRA